MDQHQRENATWTAGELLELRVSVYRSNRDTWGGKTMALRQVLEHIRAPSEKLLPKLDEAHRLYQEYTAARRDGHDPREQKRRYGNFKLCNLPVFTVRGVFPPGQRLDQTPESVNPLLVVDLDGISENLAERKGAIAAAPCVLAVFESPSRDGLKAIVAVAGEGPCTPDAHLKAWRAAAAVVKDLTGLDADTTGKNLSRTCYVSGDPAMIVKDPCAEITALSPLPSDHKAPAAQSHGRQQPRTPPGALERRMADDIPPPRDYNHWYGIVVSLRAVGLTADEIEHWSARGEGYEDGEIERRWRTMHTRSYPEGMRHLAKELRDSGAAARLNGETNRDIGCQFDLGTVLGKRIAREFHHETHRERWSIWDSGRWTPLGGPVPRRLADAVRYRVRTSRRELEDRTAYEVCQEQRSSRYEARPVVLLDEASLEAMLEDGAFLSGLRGACAAPRLREGEPQLATPDGVYPPAVPGTGTGTTEPHDPVRHDTRGLTAGRIRPSDAAELHRLLNESLGAQGAQEVLELARTLLPALMSSPEATALYSAPSSNEQELLVAAALGERAMPVQNGSPVTGMLIAVPGRYGTPQAPGPAGRLEKPGDWREWPQELLDAVVTLGLRPVLTPGGDGGPALGETEQERA